VESGPHERPHIEQLLGSDDVSVQPLLQHVSPMVHAGPPLHAGGAVQVLATQVSPGGHSFPQLLQFWGSVAVFVQPSEQQVWPPVHAGSPLQDGPPWHMLSTQLSPAAHAWPHFAQLFRSDEVSVHPLEQH
jgi:hypothetical protein